MTECVLSDRLGVVESVIYDVCLQRIVRSIVMGELRCIFDTLQRIWRAVTLGLTSTAAFYESESHDNVDQQQCCSLGALEGL